MTEAPLTDIPVIVPAAGASRRMRGADKLMLEAGGVPLLRRQVMRARAATRGLVIVALPPAPHPRWDSLADLDVTGIPVPDAHEGMSAGLRRALDALGSDARAVMILLPDLPDLTTEDLRLVLAAVAPADGTAMWCATTPDGRPGHPIVLHASLFDELRAIRGDKGARAIRENVARAGRLRGVPLGDDRALRDLDTPEAWEAWRALQEKP
ncbi:nucleotidyltransferase family protein [Roseobacter ponti]|uniref:Nucleotidyltransferase family protein n=1 Tax=Roseobacter ponti TaxID=1891787 RepID=A0A858STP7_9RHOB|nr:nucleotidyltransferase family protein [Roseobacter ponti]QJF51387.1 nucleotidyltransferase family protein [Roseobacter ponti]